MPTTPSLSNRPNTSNARHLDTTLAVSLARRSIELCAARGFAVAATVVDGSGHVLASARANCAGPATLDGSRRKAYTAVNMGMPSAAVEKLMREDIALRALGDIADFLPLQGAVPIVIDEQIVGALGVGGATGAVDESCALEAIEQVIRRSDT